MKPDRDINKLAEPFQTRVNKFLGECSSEKLHVFVTEAKRTKERQQWLYDSGRSEDRKSEPILTWTLNSKHIDGQAIDIAFKGPSLYPSDASVWNKVYDIAEKYGILSLHRKYGVDRPHLEWPGTEPYNEEEVINYKLNKFIMELPTEVLDNIKEDYKQMSVDEMKQQAASWGCMEDFEKGLTVLTKPKNYRDFKECILFGRIKS